MSEAQREPDAYVAARAHEALAKDPSLAGVHLEVEVREGTIVVSGSVGTEERKTAAGRILQEMFPGHVIRNETAVTQLSASQTEEIR